MATLCFRAGYKFYENNSREPIKCVLFSGMTSWVSTKSMKQASSCAKEARRVLHETLLAWSV